MMNSPASANLPAFDLQGHRGARGLLPENTVPAMLMALSLGVTTLEMDVHISRNGQVLLSHDPHLNPTLELLPGGIEALEGNADQHVWYNMHYNQIRQYETGAKPHPRFPKQQRWKAYKPLLTEVIDEAQAYLKEQKLPQVFYNIETKSNPETDGIYHPAPEEFVQRLMEVIKSRNMEEWVIIQSFDVRTLQVLHADYPKIITSLLVENEESLEQNLIKLGFPPTIYSPDYELVTPNLIEATHQLGIRLIPWTVNDLEKMRKLKQLGVDGLISDFPNLFKKL